MHIQAILVQCAIYVLMFLQTEYVRDDIDYAGKSLQDTLLPEVCTCIACHLVQIDLVLSVLYINLCQCSIFSAVKRP